MSKRADSRRTGHMLRGGACALLLTLGGCATGLTGAGRTIMVVPDTDPAAVARCERLAQVVGTSGSFLHGGDYGLYYALADARNRASGIAGADTLLLTDRQPRQFGGEVTGIAYNCNAPKTVSAHKASPADVQAVQKVSPAVVVPAGDIFLKAKKCQAKGGVWVNDQCVVQVE